MNDGFKVYNLELAEGKKFQRNMGQRGLWGKNG